MKTVQLAQSRLAVSDSGAGPVLLLVHGFPLHHGMWRDQIAEFSTTHRVVALDLPGFGGSTPLGDEATMEALADVCAEALDKLEISEPVVFCGLSMGGYVGWQFWRRHSDQLRALVQCDTRAVGDSAEAAEGRKKLADKVLTEGTEPVEKAMLPKLIGPKSKENPAIVERLSAMMLAAPPAGVAAALRGMAVRPDVTGDLRRIKIPALFICGRDDAITPPDEMQQIAAAIDGAEFVVIEDSGHMSPMEQPATFNQALRQFLDKLGPA